MPIDITVPRLGWNMDEGIFVAWLKQDGDLVRAGEPLFSLETDKAVQEVESLDAGRLQILPDAPRPGQTVAVGLRIGRLLEPGEAAPETAAPQGKVAAAIVSSPRARRRGRELGVDLDALSGTGRGGRIRERDVEAAAASRPAREAPRLAPAEEDFEVRPIDPTRRLIAERMMRSVCETAPVTLTTSIDAANLVNLRRQFQTVAARRPGDATPAVGYSDVVVKLSATALARHELLNARWDGERILVSRKIHIGLAVDTEAGLLVPVIRDVPALSLREVAARSRDLIDRARRRAMTPEELRGGTFTVTNLGAFGIDAFTPIINLPECAVLGMGRIHDLGAGPRMTLSLTFDHRVVDGAPAARFLQELGSMLENPGPWLLT
jgi:pyruvate dehydrogenase E2 component (dihydrolipoamide acetyltransferase)